MRVETPTKGRKEKDEEMRGREVRGEEKFFEGGVRRWGDERRGIEGKRSGRGGGWEDERIKGREVGGGRDKEMREGKRSGSGE